MLENCLPGDDTECRRDAVSIQIEELPVQTLNPTDQLLHTCVYGPCASYESPLKWIADVWTLLDKAGNNMNWDRLARKAEKRRLTVPVRETLHVVSQLGATAPEYIQRLPATRGSRTFRASPR
jgi:hypothetical protein